MTQFPILEKAELLRGITVNFDKEYLTRIGEMARLAEETANAYRKIAETVKPVTISAYKPVIELSRIANQESFKAIKEMTKQIKKVNAIQIAPIFESMSYVLDFDTSRFEMNGKLIGDLTIDEVHQVLENDSEKTAEDSGEQIPYNVFSMEYIMGFYLPALSAADSLDNLGTLDADFAFKFILFTVIPMVYFFATVGNSQKSETEIIFSDEEE